MDWHENPKSALPESVPPHERRHAVFTAGYWFKAARVAQREGNWSEALLCMENAYNHVEGALIALRNEHGIPLIDETPT